MKRKLLYTSLIAILIAIAALSAWFFWPKPSNKITLRPIAFKHLNGWQQADFFASFKAFKISCSAFLRQSPEKSVGSQFIDLKVKDWIPACQAAFSVNGNNTQEIQAFFEKWFVPVAFHDNKPIKGLFTGYYLPLLKGSLKKTKEYPTPIYRAPKNLISVDLGQFDPSLKHHRKIKGRVKGSSLVPYFTRKEIKAGAIDKHAEVVAWINNDVDRQFLEIEGSGLLQLEDGSQVYIGYEDQNGAPYTSIAKVLIDMGVMTRENASMQRIRTYLKKHPEKVESILNQNKSFVFFKILEQQGALGTQGVVLTPGYSLAVDRKWVPIGAPVWLTTTRPGQNFKQQVPFNRLMIAQDTGGAIKGAVRGDVYWGGGASAANIAGHMKNPGYYWLLLPRHKANQFQQITIDPS
ncbi:Membrane-bound lytic murein transglycosylase (plasmid) [Legionella adelaidensis]|uniref:Membrane-bound lytic murein transglycosylase A n=1 Tax=Legionella adelaidensis TaxID=45056 RepID=A0A0W0R4B7_9GAMM|nr:murein transglycosylase A [Legionella adelaidensis]KTC65854.1 Membrane-bound lytic murein transglycosylase [Legionella adelaidensis]VEH85284.1 Membrane-bound lytic murein transglycosylase [Legionella adelaidensis]